MKKDRRFRAGWNTTKIIAGIRGLRDLGWIEGQNITIEHRYANRSYTRLAEIAAELARLNVDAIVVCDSVGIRPSSQATKTIPS